MKFKKYAIPFCLLLLAALFLLPGRKSVHAESKIQYLNPGDSRNFTDTLACDNSLCISSNPSVADVSHGILRAYHPGYTTITHVKDQRLIKESICVTGIVPENPYLTVNEKKSLRVFGRNNSFIESWSSSNPSVAQVNGKGMLLAKSPGTTTIKCRLKDGTSLNTKVDVISKKHSEKLNTSSAKNKQNKETFYSFLLSCEESTFLMKTKDTYTPKITVRKLDRRSGTPLLKWSSSDSSIARVDNNGTITARQDGYVTITCTAEDQSLHFSVNVISDGENGKSCKLTLLSGSNGRKRNYTLFKQNAHNYDAFDKYLAWHGCAHCSLTTVLSAYNEKYENARPDQIISGIEKKYADPEDWSTHHEKRSLRYQMPLSLHGISTLLSKAKVNNEYLASFPSYKEARLDIISHLKTGNPIIFEVRQRNKSTGKKTTRWTNSLHTMVFLGVYTDNKHVLVCDSVDRSWYEGGQRYKIVELSDVMNYMFSSTKTTSSMYYDGASSDGGYIKIYE